MTSQLAHIAPVPTYVAKTVVHQFAESVAGKLGFKVNDAIEPLVGRLGGAVEYRSADVDRPDRLPESIVVRSHKDFTIFLPTMTSPERDRFTIAHELGHLFLHYPMVVKAQKGAIMAATRWVDQSDPVQQRAEWEANWFAAAFLMPTEQFRAAMREWNSDPATLGLHFGVSAKAAEVRIRTI